MVLIGRDLVRYHVSGYNNVGHLRKALNNQVPFAQSYLTWNGYHVIDECPLSVMVPYPFSF